ncbi:hypothetical protein KY334_05390, partial [Candidatus Woesearchaeota archaeon]|nr:hypothetical protein [Candidatus Woesearchaeota archaeon]
KINFVRMPVDSMIGIDLTINGQKFDENFNALEFNEYLKRCKEFKLVPFNGFYFDVLDSWKYFGYTNGKDSKPKILDKMLIEADKKYVEQNKEKLTLVMENDANKILNYLIEKGK